MILNSCSLSPSPIHALASVQLAINNYGVARLEVMVDRVYKEELPRLRSRLEKLKDDFYELGNAGTNWAGLRIEPLLKHLDSLEQLLHSSEFSQEFSRLRKGVEMFHSDLVYLRTNVKGLQGILEAERKD